MAIIDDKVVAMSFENSKFQSGVSQTLSALDKLKAALNFGKAGKGFDDLDAAAKKVDLSRLGSAVDNIASRLSLLGIAGAAVFASIALKAASAAASIAKSFTIGPIQAGFAEYSTNLNSIQTILANTQAAGTKLPQVNAALKELNEYSDKTIYNFSQMARNIGTFTAAGVDLKTSTAAIKGIANLAALSGSNAEQASTAMYQLSQALAAGKVSLMDWNSVVNAGMGGTVFQRALANTAVQMGTLSEGAVKLSGKMKNVTINGEAFRNSLSAPPGKEAWLTSEVLTKTLSQFTGDLKNAELAAMGFNKAQIASIQQTAKTAQAAATEVKTIKQVFDVARETAGSGWAQTFQIIFGTFEEAKTTFTALSNSINGFINKSADARNKVLQDWKDLGGRTLLIDSIRTAFENLGMILKPIKEAFREIFPAKTGADLMYLTQQFNDFANALKPSKETMENLKRTFAGVFAIFSIGISIIKGVFTALTTMFGAIGGGTDGFLKFTATIGDFLVGLDQAIKKSDGFRNFFVTLGNVLSKPIELLSKFASTLVETFSGFSGKGVSSQFGGMTSSISLFSNAMAKLTGIWDSFMDSFSGGGGSGAISGFIQDVAKALAALGPALGEATTNMNFDLILNAIRTGFFGALVIMIKQFLGPGSLVSQVFGKNGIVGNISQSFGALTNSMQAMTNNIRADTLQKLAIAIGILTVSIVALSFVDPDRLVSSLTAIGVGFGILLGAMQVLTAVTKTSGFIKMPFIAASLSLLAGSIVILSAAVIMLSFLSWEQLLKGLGGVAVLLAAITVAAIPLSASSAGMIRAGVGITAIAAAMILLATAVQIMGRMELGTLAKGLGGIAVGLGLMVIAMNLIPKVPLRSTVGLVAMAAALVLLSGAVKLMGSMDLMTLGKGLGAIAVGLGIMVAAMTLMPKGILLQAAALVLVATALQGIARAVKSMGGMSWEEMAKGLTGLAVSLGILAGALILMTGTTAGSIALTTAATALAFLAPALVLLGKQTWKEVATGLISLAGALVIMGLAGVALGPVAPALFALGAALIFVGGGLALAGAGIALIGIGLSSIAVAAPTAVGILIAAIMQILDAVPKMVTDFVAGILALVQAFAETAPLFVDAIVKIIDSILDVIIRSTPKLAETFVTLLAAAIQIVAQQGPKFIQAGFKLLEDFLTGLKNNIPKIVPIAVDAIVRFLNAVAAQASKLVTAGANLIVQLLEGIANNLGKIVTAVGTIITTFLNAVANNISRIITAGTNIIVAILNGIANSLSRIITAGTNVVVAFITGIGNSNSRIVTAAVQAITKFIQAIAKGAVKLVDEGFKAIILFLNGIADAINSNAGEMRAAGIRVAVAIIDGMTFGLASQAGRVIGAAADLGRKALGALGKAIKFFSPSHEARLIGEGFAQGFALGITPTQAMASATAMGQSVITAMTNLFQIQSPSKVMYEIGKLVGQGFAQGIRGSGDDVRKAFADLNEKLTEEMRTARAAIIEEQNKLEKLRKEKKPDPAEMKALQASIKENQDILDRVTAGHKALVVQLKDEKKELIGLTADYDKITERLKAAKDVLANAIKTRDDAAKSITSQYSALPSLVDPMTNEIKSAREAIAEEQKKLEELRVNTEATPEKIEAQQAAVLEAQAKFDSLVAGKILNAEKTSVDQLATYINSLKLQADAVAAYSATLQQLRKLGLDDATYQKLLAEGPADAAFANQLLAGGKTAVEGLNTLDAQLMKVSKTLGTNASTNLYQAGVDAAAGLVKGLEKKQSAIRKQMEQIALGMLGAIRKALKIKSPSEEFDEIGQATMEGMAQGIRKSSKRVITETDAVGRAVINSLQKSMKTASQIISDGLKSNPVITPIVDLGPARDTLTELEALSELSGLGLGSLATASQISADQTSAQTEQAATPAATYVLEQNNYSPESLDTVEIYRQTKNQLSQLKGLLAT